jgi:hypothetical protein
MVPGRRRRHLAIAERLKAYQKSRGRTQVRAVLEPELESCGRKKRRRRVYFQASGSCTTWQGWPPCRPIRDIVQTRRGTAGQAAAGAILWPERERPDATRTATCFRGRFKSVSSIPRLSPKRHGHCNTGTVVLRLFWLFCCVAFGFLHLGKRSCKCLACFEAPDRIECNSLI